MGEWNWKKWLTGFLSAVLVFTSIMSTGIHAFATEITDTESSVEEVETDEEDDAVVPVEEETDEEVTQTVIEDDRDEEAEQQRENSEEVITETEGENEEGELAGAEGVSGQAEEDAIESLTDEMLSLSAEDRLELMTSVGDIASGTYKNIAWVIDANGKLTVNGSGEVLNYNDRAPWYDQREQIKSAKINVTKLIVASDMFYGCSNLTSLDLSGFATSQVRYMDGMFYDCSSLVSLDLSGFATSQVTTMAAMFYGCSSLTSLNLSGFATSQVRNMRYMFYGCSRLSSLDLGGFATSCVTDMTSMFCDCRSLTSLDLSGFDTSQVMDMTSMFYGCRSLNSLDLSGFDTSCVTDMGGMFFVCRSLTTIHTPYNLTQSVSLPLDNAGDRWYRSDGTIVTELPQNLSYSVILGKNYIPEYTSADIEVSIRHGDRYGSYAEPLSAIFSNNYFVRSAYNYNHDLAWLTLCLELSSWTADFRTWGNGDTDTSELAQSRYANISDAYKQMGFESVKYYNYGNSLNDTNDKVAYSVAAKSNVDNSTLVAVVIRGGGYGCEWSSNFNVGGNDLNYHTGFYTAANIVFDSVSDYISAIDGDVKLWITGYSRGAAVANLLAAKLDNYAATSVQFNAEDIFTYTFATPQGVTTNQNVTGSLYKNIFNIVNPGDIVPMVAPSGWNFTRYGITKYFCGGANEDILQAVQNKYFYFSKDDTLSAEKKWNQSAAGTALMKIILNAFPTVDSSRNVQEVLKEILEFHETKVKPGNRWENISVDDFFGTLYRRYGDDYYLASTKASEFLLSKDARLFCSLLGTFLDAEKATEEAYLIFSLCELHGIRCGEVVDMLINLINCENIRQAVIAYFNLDSIKTAHTDALYLAWMSLDEEDAFWNESVLPVLGGATVASIACPVDVVAYDTERNKVAVIKDHKLIEASIPVVVGNEITMLYFPPYEKYSVEITSANLGSMTYTVTEMDINQNVVNRVNYFDIELKEGRIFTGDVNTTSDYVDGKYNLAYIEDNIKTIISPDEKLNSDLNVTLQIKTLGEGVAVGASRYIKGDTVELKAYADEGSHFSGWYMDGKLLSTDEIYCIRLLEDSQVTCLFEADVKPPSSWPFLDVAVKPGNWRYDNVKFVYEYGIMTGVKTDQFQPDVPLTRAQFASVIYRMAGTPKVSYKGIFTDVPAGKWYSDAIIWAYEKGIVAGLGGGRYGVNENITREQMARMLMEFARVQGYDTSVQADFANFADGSQVSRWATENMRWAVGSGIISGSTKDGKYYMNPKGEAKRVECAVMLTKFIQKYL